MFIGCWRRGCWRLGCWRRGCSRRGCSRLGCRFRSPRSRRSPRHSSQATTTLNFGDRTFITLILGDRTTANINPLAFSPVIMPTFNNVLQIRDRASPGRRARWLDRGSVPPTLLTSGRGRARFDSRSGGVDSSSLSTPCDETIQLFHRDDSVHVRLAFTLLFHKDFHCFFHRQCFNINLVSIYSDLSKNFHEIRVDVKTANPHMEIS